MLRLVGIILLVALLPVVVSAQTPTPTTDRSDPISCEDFEYREDAQEYYDERLAEGILVGSLHDWTLDSDIACRFEGIPDRPVDHTFDYILMAISGVVVVVGSGLVYRWINRNRFGEFR